MGDYEGAERRDVHWHMDKRISFSHMLSTIVIGGALIGVYTDIGAKLVEARADIDNMKVEVNRIDGQHIKRMDSIRIEQKEAVKKVDRNLDRINQKLDRLIEREINGKHK